MVDEKIRELELIKKVLSTKKETLEKGIDTDSIGKITRRYIPRRHILSMNYEPV